MQNFTIIIKYLNKTVAKWRMISLLEIDPGGNEILGKEGHAQSYHFIFIIWRHQVQMVNFEQLSMTSELVIYFIIVIN